MSLKNISANNFRSFKEIDINFGRFNVIIGANAAGKSNLIQLFKFLRDLNEYGPQNAIQLQGGMEYLKNFKIDKNESDFKITDEKNEVHTINLKYSDSVSFDIDTKINDTIKIFDFDTRLAKSSSSLENLVSLNSNAGNLPIAIKNVFSEPDKKREFLNYLNFILPFIKDVEIKENLEKSAVIYLTESYPNSKPLIGSMLSDGTISIICIIIAIFFDESNVAVFEEPDRSCHPQTYDKLIKLFYEASNFKQIFLSTHNPELLKYCRLEDIYLVSRDKDGLSQIRNVTDYSELKVFLDQNMGIDQIFCDLLLGE